MHGENSLSPTMKTEMECPAYMTRLSGYLRKIASASSCRLFRSRVTPSFASLQCGSESKLIPLILIFGCFKSSKFSAPPTHTSALFILVTLATTGRICHALQKFRWVKEVSLLEFGRWTESFRSRSEMRRCWHLSTRRSSVRDVTRTFYVV